MAAPLSDPNQKTFNFNPIEATPQQSEFLRRLSLQWTLEEEAEDFKRLPGETLEEFWAARDAHLRAIELFGPAMPREPCAAWQMMHGQRPLPRKPQQLLLPFDDPKPGL